MLWPIPLIRSRCATPTTWATSVTVQVAPAKLQRLGVVVGRQQCRGPDTADDGGEQQQAAGEVGRPAQPGRSGGMRERHGSMERRTPCGHLGRAGARGPCPRAPASCFWLPPQVWNFQVRAASRLLAMSRIPLVSWTRNWWPFAELRVRLQRGGPPVGAEGDRGLDLLAVREVRQHEGAARHALHPLAEHDHDLGPGRHVGRPRSRRPAGHLRRGLVRRRREGPGRGGHRVAGRVPDRARRHPSAWRCTASRSPVARSA